MQKSPPPLYKQLKAKLVSAIESNIYSEGERIPTEMQLSKEHGLSRITVRKALDEMAKEGYLNRIQGSGTYVTEKKMRRPISRGNTFISFTMFCQELGMKPGAKVILVCPQSLYQPVS